MRDYLPFLVIGLTTGGVYALNATGLVLTYRTTGIFNFAHGAIGMFVTYIFYSLRSHMPTAVAVSLALLVIAPLMGVVIDRLLVRRLEGAGPATYLVTSLGLLVGLQALATIIYGGRLRRVDGILPRGTYRLLDINVGVDQTLVVLIAIVAALALLLFFRLTYLGLQTRAVVSDRSLTSLTGVNPNIVTTLSWMLGCSFATLAGILFVPFIGLDPLLLSLLIVECFGAAAVGRLVSFPVAIVAAFGLGVAQSLATKVVSAHQLNSLLGLPGAIPFFALLGALLLSKKGSLREVTESTPPVVRGRKGERFRFPFRPLLLAFGVLAALPPFLNGYRVITLTATAAMLLMFISLSLLVGLSRQVSLCHSVFMVFGATTLAYLLKSGVPYLIALPLAALVLVPVGAIVAIPAIRLSGLYLALATFAFAILAQNLLYKTPLAFGNLGSVGIPRPQFLMGDRALFYFVLAIAGVGTVIVELVRVSRLGRVLTALADSPRAVESMGISPVVARVLTFCLSAFLAALAGGLFGTIVQRVSQDTFNAFQSLIWIAVLVAVGSKTLGGSVLAAVLLVTVPGVLETRWADPVHLALYLGVGAIIFARAENGFIGYLSRPDLGRWLRDRRVWTGDSARSLERYLRRAGAESAMPERAVGG